MKTERRTSYRFGLAGKAVFIPVLLIVVSGMMLTYLSSALNEYFTTGKTLASIRNQEVLVEQYLRSAMLSTQMIPVSPNLLADQIESDLQQLLQANPVFNVTPATILKHASTDPDLTVLVNAQIASFADVKNAINKYLAESSQSKMKNKLFEELYHASQQLQMIAEETVRVYDQHLDTDRPWWDVDAVAVELAERQRIQIQQYIKEVLFTANGLPTDFTHSKETLYKSLALLVAGGTISLTPDEVVDLPKPQYEDIRFVLISQKKSLDRFDQAVKDYLKLSDVQGKMNESLKSASDQVSYYASSARQLSNNLDLFYRNQLTELRSRVYIVGGVFSCLALILFWQFIHFMILKPIRQVREGISKLGEGDTTVQLAKIRKDEMGDLGAELNRASKKLHLKTVMLNRFAEGDDDVDFATVAPQDRLGQSIFKSVQRLKSIILRSKDELASLNDDISKELMREKNVDEISIIGQLPGEGVSINEKDLFQQLLDRANQLRFQQEELLDVNNRLKQDNEKLLAAESKLKSTEERVSMRNLELEQLINQNDLQFEKQRQEIETLSVNLLTKESQLEQINNEVVQGVDTLTARTLRKTHDISRKAEELRQLAGQVEVKELRLSQLQQQLDGYEGKLNGDQAAHIDENIEELYEKVKAQALSIQRLQNEVSERDRVAHQASEELTNRMRELDKVRKAFNITKQDLETSKILIEDQSQKIDLYESEVNLIKSELDKNEDGVRIRTELLMNAKKELKLLENQLKEVFTQKQEMERELERQAQTHASNLAAVKAQEVAAKELLLEAQRTIDSRSNELKRIKEESLLSQQQYDHQVNEMNQIYNQKNQALFSQIQEATQKISSLSHECSTKSDAILSAENRCESLKNENKLARTALQSKEVEYRNLLVQTSDLQRKLLESETELQLRRDALKAADHRLIATRTALSAALEELQEMGGK